MVATVNGSSLSGVSAHSVRVEVDFIKGLPGLDMVGLPEIVVRESKARILTAINNSNYKLPHRRFIVNLAPADLPKSGSSFDLAIAIGLLSKCGMCAPNRLSNTLILGELSLEGTIQPIRGLLAHLRAAKDRAIEAAIIPEIESQTAALVTGIDIFLAKGLVDVVDFLNNSQKLPRIEKSWISNATSKPEEDLSDVRGQQSAKRALEVAACGMHNIIMVGPPGTGKTMLAQRLRGILPPPSDDEALQIATISSIAGVQISANERGLMRPYRAPHHTISDVGLVGGGVPIRPGEVTLSHLGVLFLDEFPEFRRNSVEALRTVIELKKVVIVRAKERAVMPAGPLLVAAMNPCPCGYLGDERRVCRCSPDQILRYQNRISGPLLDRFDIHVQLSPVNVGKLRSHPKGESTHAIAKRIVEARNRLKDCHPCYRWKDGPMQNVPIERLSENVRVKAMELLQLSIDKLGLSLRAYHKVLNVAHTIAILEEHDRVEAKDMAEAIQYRVLDRDPCIHSRQSRPLSLSRN